MLIKLGSWCIYILHDLNEGILGKKGWEDFTSRLMKFSLSIGSSTLRPCGDIIKGRSPVGRERREEGLGYEKLFCTVKMIPPAPRHSRAQNIAGF